MMVGKLIERDRRTSFGRFRKRLRDLLVLRVLGLNDTPHRIALGVAVGIFVAWTPTIPFQMVLAFLLCAALGANKIVGQPFVWITNPVTAIPLYWFNFAVGCGIIPAECSNKMFLSTFREALSLDDGFVEAIRHSWQATLQFFWPLWIGSLFVGILLGLLSYFICFQGVQAYRLRKAAKALSHGSV